MQHQHRPTDDRGFTLIEILITILIIGILAAVVVFSVRGITDRGQDNACETDARVVATAVEAYLAQNRVPTIPSTPPVDSEQYERTLRQAGLVRNLSQYWDVAAEGYLVNVTPC